MLRFKNDTKLQSIPLFAMYNPIVKKASAAPKDERCGLAITSSPYVVSKSRNGGSIDKNIVVKLAIFISLIKSRAIIPKPKT